MQLLSTLNHPCIVGYKESVLEDDHTLLIFMEYCDGGDLSQAIKQRKRLARREGEERARFPEEQILDWFVQIALALKCMHKRNILHRDLKTQNCFLTDNGRLVKLGDFGISKVLGSDQVRVCV